MVNVLFLLRWSHLLMMSESSAFLYQHLAATHSLNSHRSRRSVVHGVLENVLFHEL